MSKTVQRIEDLSAYTLIKKENLEEYKSIGYLLSHNKTKARVMVLTNDDNNKVFNIGFRTPPADDSGIPHIMEHSVLCGSKNFPAKDPFVELCKGSLNTFLNAMTYSDKTVYPVASLNKKDFHNLMHVYLDAVFYPNIYDREEIMMQEGWHYEIDDNGDLFVNGVVFNEMKGVYSSAEDQLYRIIEKSLLPNTPYGFESGGDPDYIPKLTRETFLDFHKKYYHPSNSYIYLYGDMDACAELEFIDKEYLDKYDYLEIDSSICDEKAFDEPKLWEQYYSLADAEEEKNNTYLAYNVVVGKSTDKKLCMAFDVIEYALISAPGAPIKKALIDANIGKDVFSSYDDGINQPTFSIISKNANNEDLDKFIKVINDCLNKIIDEGIDKKAFLAAINNFEFKHKESNFGRYPKGLMIGLNAFDTWLYNDDEALSTFTLNYVFDELKKDIETNTHYFENLIKDLIVNNNHKTYVRFMPKKGLNTEKTNEEKQRLANIKASLSALELENIKKAAEHLKNYQSEPSTKEELETIPMIEISDIDKNARKLNNHLSEIEMVKVVNHKIFTNGISYVRLNFDISDVEAEKYSAVALLTEILKYVDTKDYSYNELASEINLHTGGISFTTSVCQHVKEGTKVLFVANLKMLDEKIDKAMNLLEEILFTSRIDDKKRLKEIIAETRSDTKNDLVSSGHITAAGRASSYMSYLYSVKEKFEGLDYYNFLADLDDNFEERYDSLVALLRTVLGEILTRNGLLVSYTSDKDPKEMLHNSITSLSKKLSSRLRYDDTNKKELVVKNEGFKTSSQVQYVATAGNFKEAGLEFTGSLNVLQTIFSYDYLWINVRVKGGAYGCMCSFNRSGDSFFTSYRDPNLMETYEIYKNAPKYVENFDASDRDMTKYIIGAISKLDAPLTPSTEGNYCLAAYLTGITEEDIQKSRDEVLSTDVSKIRALAPYISAVVNSGIICAIGDENKIEANKENFKEVLSTL
ncbi:MAG: insulinase family protein [Lachnospiraceae bacterium]|nr:insulinase family protein [Lachnospiraceae bacterium]